MTRNRKIRDAPNQNAPRRALAHAGEAPRWSLIAKELATAIERGDYSDGSMLPAASAVAARYGVHRHTVRQAFRHLQDLGLVTVARGRGTTVLAQPFPYRLGRRVSLRSNFGAAGLDVEGRIIESGRGLANEDVAGMLAIPAGNPVWEIRTLNFAAGVPVSTGLHRLDLERFPDFDLLLAEEKASISAAFRRFGIDDYVRLSTRLCARTASDREAELLRLAAASPVLQSIAVDGLPDGTPLQAIEGAFAGGVVEMVIDLDR